MTPAHLKACIQQCWECRDTCQTLLFNHCLEAGGPHVERNHVTLMSDCMEICQTAADAMTRNSPAHAAVCTACAEVCEACARSCDAIDDEHMRHCAEVCRACARTCRDMGQMKVAA